MVDSETPPMQNLLLAPVLPDLFCPRLGAVAACHRLKPAASIRSEERSQSVHRPLSAAFTDEWEENKERSD